MDFIGSVQRPSIEAPALKTIGSYDKVVMAKPEVYKWANEASVTGNSFTEYAVYGWMKW